MTNTDLIEAAMTAASDPYNENSELIGELIIRLLSEEGKVRKWEHLVEVARQDSSLNNQSDMTLVSENSMGPDRILQVWTSPNREDVEGLGWNWNKARFEEGVWGNTKTVSPTVPISTR